MTNLSHLDLGECDHLKELTATIGQLTNLSHLDLGECRHLEELSETIGKLTKLGHLELGRCVSLKRLPEAIKQLTNLGSLNLVQCRSLTRLPDQLGEMKCLKKIDASYTSIEQLPDSIGHLKELVDLKLCDCKKLRKLPEQIGNMESLKLFDASYSAIEHLSDTFAGLVNLEKLHLRRCENLTSLPNSLWKLKVLRVLDLDRSSKLKQLPEQLRKMQYLKYLSASGTAIEELPESIGLLSMLKELNLDYCKNFRKLPSTIKNLTSLEELYLDLQNMDTIILPGMVKDMKLNILKVSCNLTLWLPVIQCLSSLIVILDLWYANQILSSNEPYSLFKLSNLQYLELDNQNSRKCSGLPLKLKMLRIRNYATLEMLPDLSSLKQLEILFLLSCISLQSIPPLPPRLEELILFECISLQDLPDLSMLKKLRHFCFRHCINLKSISLKQSFLQVGQHKLHSFIADIPNKEVAEWFSYKCNGNTLSFTIPPNSGDNSFGVGLWIVYKCKYTDERGPYVRAVITNRTKDIKTNYHIYLPSETVVGEVQSWVECKWDKTMKSGDRIKISFQSVPRPLYYTGDSFGGDFTDGRGAVKVKRCGAHVILRTPR